MSTAHSSEFDDLMNDLVEEGGDEKEAFLRSESVSVLIRPIKPMRIRLREGVHAEEAYDLTEATESEEMTLTRPTSLTAKATEDAYWSLLSSQMRTVLQSIVGYSELIEEDLLAGELLAPLGDLLRIRNASHELLDMACQIEDLLALEREKRRVAERLGSLSRQLSYAVDRDAIYASLLSSIASLIPFLEARVYERRLDWKLTMRWGRYSANDEDIVANDLCNVVARAASPCVQPIGALTQLGFPVRVEGACVAVLLLSGDFEDAEVSRHVGLLAPFITQVEKALSGWRELDHMKRMAMYDGLTGALTRRAFFDEAKGRNGERAVIMLDIDHFKRINDTYGHGGGDEVLREVARRVRATLRTNDIVGRYGGEEFALLLDVDDSELASEIAERVRCALADLPVALPSGDMISVTASLGVAIGTESMDALIDRADRHLYHAKRTGRNRVCDGLN